MCLPGSLLFSPRGPKTADWLQAESGLALPNRCAISNGTVLVPVPEDCENPPQRYTRGGFSRLKAQRSDPCLRRRLGMEVAMRRPADVLYGVAMAAVIVLVDVVFLRGRFWERLLVNIGIVLAFAAIYLTFLKRP